MISDLFCVSVKNKGGPNLWRPHRIANLTGQKIRTVVSSCSACHSVLITAEGKALTFGKKFYVWSTAQ